MSDSPFVIAVSGASSGIGAAVSRELACQPGARIALLARREDKLREVAEAVRAAGALALPVACDVADINSVRQAMARVEDEFGPIDLVFANAGIGEPVSMKKFPIDTIHKVMRINFEGVVNIFSCVVPSMVSRGRGHLVAVSSIAGYRGLPGSAAYSASKAAVSTFLESLRLDLRGTGIDVTAIHPGFVKTPMTDSNRFPMPFLVPLDQAAERIAAGVLARKREINFPWQMVLLLRIVRALPAWLYDRVAAARSPFKKS